MNNDRIFFTANLAGQIRTWAGTWENHIPELLKLATPAERSQAQLRRDRNDKMAQLIAGELSALLSDRQEAA